MQHSNLATKIRANLLEQKRRLEEYLTLLEREEEDIIKEDADRLIEHINLEKNIIDEITSFRKILEPIEVIYFNDPYKKDRDIIAIKANVDNMLQRVKSKANENKEKLATVISKIDVEIKNLRKRGLTRAVYSGNESQILDLNG